MKFPKTLYVKSEKEGNTQYFAADADAASLVDMGQKVKIASYQLIEVTEAEGVAKFNKR